MTTNTLDTQEDLERIVFSIVSYSGEAKGYAYEALRLSEDGDFDAAQGMMEKCNESVLKAHGVQTEMIHRELGGDKFDVSMIMVHAQDHLMTTLSERELIRRMIEQNRRLHTLEKVVLGQ